jgi:hypothetical protein
LHGCECVEQSLLLRIDNVSLLLSGARLRPRLELLNRCLCEEQSRHLGLAVVLVLSGVNGGTRCLAFVLINRGYNIWV